MCMDMRWGRGSRRATKEHIRVSEIVIDESEIALGDVRSGVMGRGRDVCPLLGQMFSEGGS